MAFEVVFAPEAEADLIDLYDFIATRDGPERAAGYISRIEAACRRLAHFPERGRLRDDIRPGLRVSSLEQRVTIAFHVHYATVTIDRVLYGGRDLGAAFGVKSDVPR